MASVCCIPMCKNTSKTTQGLPFFTFPSSIEQRNLWSKASGINPAIITERHRICGVHFEKDDYFTFATTHRLKKGRVPHRHLIEKEAHNEPETIPFESFPQQVKIEDHSVSTRGRVVRKKQAKALSFCVERFARNDKKILYYTGIQTFKIMCTIFRYVLKSEKGGPGAVHQKVNRGIWKKPHHLTPFNEFFLTLVKLRRGYDYEELGDHFDISKATAARIFSTWVQLLYLQLASLSIFPNRETILANAPPGFLSKYPNVIGSIDCTEFAMQVPSSLVRRSQCYSHYKGTNTLKALIMIDPNGAIIFVSSLFTGSISDKKILEDSRFIHLLQGKVARGELQRGDIILADKGFNVSDLVLKQTGVQLNIPTFRITGIQFQPQEVEYIRTIAHERVHVERAIRRIKTFKILTQKTPIALMGQINEIFTVCALLTNFRFPLRK